MMIYYYLICVAALFLLLSGYLVIGKAGGNKADIAKKAVAVLLGVMLYVRFSLSDSPLESVLALTLPEGGLFASKANMVVGFIQQWFMYACELAVLIYPFRKLKSATPQFAFFFLPVSIVNIICVRNLISAVVGASAFEEMSLKAILLSCECGILLGYSLLIVIKNRREIILDGKKEWLYFALALIGMIAVTAPNYTGQFFIDPGEYAMEALDLEMFHRIFLYPVAVIPILLYFLLRDLPKETKRTVLLYYALAALICYTETHKFADLTHVTNLPLHLCNTAIYITPFCLAFDKKKLFYFTYFINVLGAFLALMMPSAGNCEILRSGTWSFFRSHYQAFFMPLLAVGLGIFARPRLKEFKYSMIGFAVYFYSIIFVNGWFANYDKDVDFFFLNSDFVADKLGNWAVNLRANFQLDFDIGSLHFKFYPAYQIPYFLVYVALAFGMWFIYEASYEKVSAWIDITEKKRAFKRMKQEFKAVLGDRKENEPINMEATDKLILKGFTKRYGKSDVYAVKDANLEVHGGEIFGFLGPNGAGKSTIIKSIVGIQTITGGSIEVCGYDVATQSVMAKQQIGFVPDHYALYERLTAREYINYVADLYNVSKEDREERLNKFIEIFEFAHAIDNRIKTYSHGMKQKVTIMSALIHDPKVWILDEPLTGLDPNSIFQVKECMRHHAERGNIVFFSSHIIDVVERICDRIAIIKKGQIQCVEAVKDLEARGIVLEDYYMDIIEHSDAAAIPVCEEKVAK